MAAGSTSSYVVGVVAALLALAVCGCAVVLVNLPEVVAAFGVPGWISVLVSAAAVVLALLVAAVGVFAVIPRRWQ